jgi:ferredoxin-thioredoxin reductase catalytic subunit
LKIVVNTDQELVDNVRAMLKLNNGYCPCVTVRNKDTKCMCKNFREQEFEGECHCGLYVKVKE